MSRPRRQLAFAASTRKVGFAFFKGKEVLDWGIKRKASRDIDAAFKQAADWISYYRPSRVFVEEIDGGTRKGRHTVSLIHTLAAAARDRDIEVIEVVRRRRHKSKYAEAAELAKRYPQLRAWVPKPRRPWEPEAHRMVIFEAVALFDEWIASQEDR